MESKPPSYIIEPKAKEISFKSNPATKVLVAKKWHRFSSKITFGCVACVWAVCGTYAYHVWKHKEVSSKVNDIAVIDTVESEKEKSYEPTAKLGWFKSDIGVIKIDDEYKFSKFCVSNNQNVVMNEKFKRFEVAHSWKSINYVTFIDFDIVKKDDDGNFVFDEAGYPIEIPSAIQKFVSDDIDRARRFFKLVFSFVSDAINIIIKGRSA